MKRQLTLLFVLVLTLLPVTHAEFGASSDGPWHSLTLENGDVYSVGINKFGVLGVQDIEQTFEPILVPGLSEIVGVYADRFVSLAIDSNGTIYGWGRNSGGMLVPDGEEVIYEPVAITQSSADAIITVLPEAIILEDDSSITVQGRDSLGLVQQGQFARFGDRVARPGNMEELLRPGPPSVDEIGDVDEGVAPSVDVVLLQRIAGLEAKLAALEQVQVPVDEQPVVQDITVLDIPSTGNLVIEI